MGALGAAYVTYATNDYRPILIRGVWSCATAFLAFLGSTLAAERWKARVLGIMGALLVLALLPQLLSRLAAIARAVP